MIYVIMNKKGLFYGSSQFRKSNRNLDRARHGPARHRCQTPDRYAYIENTGFDHLLGRYSIASLDDATLAAAELGPRLSIAQTKGNIMASLFRRNAYARQKSRMLTVFPQKPLEGKGLVRCDHGTSF